MLEWSHRQGDGMRIWWRTNQGVGVALSVAVAALLIYLLFTDWVYIELRDGFKLGFFPLLAVIATLLCTLSLIVDSRRHEVEEGGDGIDLKSWIYCFSLLVGSYIYFVVAQAIGFLIATPVVLAGFTYLLGVRPWSFAFLAGVIMTAMVYGVFSIFGVPMPPGILPF